MTLLRSAVAVVVLCALFAGASTPVTANPDLTARNDGVIFALGPDANYVTGCFPAPPLGCAGPVILYPVFLGGFESTPAGRDPEGFDVFLIDHVLFIAGGGTQFFPIVGDGIYRRRVGKNPAQEMILDLSIAGGPVNVFDSGLVDLDPSLNAIDISIDMNDQINYDTVMRIAANPVQAAIHGVTATKK